MERKFHQFSCIECGKSGQENRRVDLKRQCPWSIVAYMQCECGFKWKTYIRDRDRETPFDIVDEEDE